MERKNYKVIDRPEMTKEEILAGMNFALATSSAFIPLLILKKIPLNTLLAVGITTVVGVTSILIAYNLKKDSNPVNKEVIVTDSTSQIIDTAKEEIEMKKTDSSGMQIQSKLKTEVILNNTTSTPTHTNEINETNAEETITESIPSVPFERNISADIPYAITIKDSIYSQINVSRGYGYALEYKEGNNARTKENNSIWFKFTVSKDTLLTFHIVPNYKTDDYDFALFKCESQNCAREISSGKLKPIRSCSSWNTSQNPNTGISNRALDTTYQAVNFKGEGQGKTYSSALKVKKGETFYLLVNAPAVGHQEPSGFSLYFYNYLPKKKMNKYNK